MGCIITNGVDLACNPFNVGGINKIYLANLDDIASYNYNLDGSIEEIVMKATKVFYKFDFSESTGLTTTELQNNNGAKSFLHGCGFSVPKLSQDVINTMTELAASKLVAIVESREARDVAPFLNQNRQHLFGGKNGLTATTLTGASGQNSTDYAGFTIVLNGSETTELLEIVPDSVTYTTIQSYIDTLD